MQEIGSYTVLLFLQSSCRGHGGRLAEVTTKAQSDYLISMVKLLKNGHDYWLGGRDDIIEGTWQWASTDRVFTYTAWGPGNPSNTGGNEDCLHLHDFPPEGIKWNDNACQVGMKFICEKPKSIYLGLADKFYIYQRLSLVLLIEQSHHVAGNHREDVHRPRPSGRTIR
ncbi:unnamed protein product [Mytilus edulis]|uniref:C-type lectin domain-containing protein n=1 Tax=Mytilus edulis TaxID=6550 RepID=A0A8S3QBN1_MYTED|nr:unnamed protein product [Mytilus edulis]